MDPWWLALSIWLGSAVVMAATWVAAMRVRNLAFMDIGWAGCMTLAALAVGLFAEGSSLMRALTALAGATWGMRLCLYYLHRTMHEPVDGRHRILREAWGDNPARYFVLFQRQALLAALLALSFIGAASSPLNAVTHWTIAALAVWVVALAGETTADLQLDAHRASSAIAPETCRSGLWAWSRHPNYVFETLHWFTYVLLGVGAPTAWMTWAGPMLILLMLWRLTGIPWTERQALRSRGESYARYQREVPIFLPRPGKRPAP